MTIIPTSTVYNPEPPHPPGQSQTVEAAESAPSWHKGLGCTLPPEHKNPNLGVESQAILRQIQPLVPILEQSYRHVSKHVFTADYLVTTSVQRRGDMGGLLTLLSLSTVMGMASFLAGILPLTLTLSQSQLRLISTIGMGVLVGTSLIVIIPEGVNTLLQPSPSTAHHRRDLTQHNTLDIRWAQSTAPLETWHISTRGFDDDDDVSPFDMPGPVVPDTLKRSTQDSYEAWRGGRSVSGRQYRKDTGRAREGWTC